MENPAVPKSETPSKRRAFSAVDVFRESPQSGSPPDSPFSPITLRHPLANEIPSPDEKLQGQISPPRARRMQAIRVTPASGDDTSSPHTGETPTDYSHATLAGCVATRGHAARDIPTPTVFAPDARA